ncbi:putative RHS repeat-associated core domain-containing protein [Alteromonas sp. 38]|uniref:toxin TcdB middle/N-terminal domain-containing protein n=1 Tax=unclassified Alteromonas TaxID=2614992 RepID=UPI0012F1A4AD|nr:MULTISPECIES: toxin TcdB middle/N-terminal domain-containing protein [unclassified Alteromonas]CAD5287905.1 putative RHS repeat-associated core domain-containing protein [Alteromonas sp. 154]VXB27998.1 putative RHS repeat-associated core domain-containing protein [Alteromonas sp. 38]
MKALHSLFAIVLAVLPTFAFAEKVGLTPGDFRVDESGSATYTIPIAAPTGRAGVQPQMALSYSSSNSFEGPLGVGWNISGLSAISRCPKNLSQDGRIEGVNINKNDRFCLDGQKMKVKSGSYGAPNTNYYLENDDFSHAKALGGDTENGPRWFVVWKKSGELFYYGDTRNDSTVGSVTPGTDAFITASGASSARANTWMLKAIRDRKGNYIRFSYLKEYGSSYISKVEYSGHLGKKLAPFASINFNYTNKSFYASGYNNKGYSMRRKVLTSVVSKVDGVEYRAYKLAYNESKRRMLTSVQECPTLASSTTNCLKPTTLTWTHPNTTTAVDYTNAYSYITGDEHNRYEAQVFDLTGDGKSDLMYVKSGYWRLKSATSTSTTTLTNIGDSGSQRQYALNIDYNGDGVRDLLVADGEDKNWYIVYYENTKSAPARCEGTSKCPSHTVSRSLKKGYIKNSSGANLRAWGFKGGAAVMDVNGDGFEDIVYRKGKEVRAYLNTGNKSFTDNHLFTFSSELSGDALFGHAQMYRATIKSASAIDINGDGLSDIILQVTSTDGYCTNSRGDRLFAQTRRECEGDLMGTWQENTTSNRQVFISKTNSANDPYFSKVQTLSASYKDIRYADLNGDGLTDMIYSYASKWRYRLSNGKTFGAEQILTQPYDTDSANYSQFVDVNYDGKADMLYATSNSSWTIYVSSLTTSPSKVNFTYVRTRSFGSNNTIRFGDGNGDGNLDLYIGSSSDWRRYSIRVNQNEYTVNKITNGFGVATNIKYTPMTNTALYFRQDSSYNTHTNVFSPFAGGKLVSEVRTDVTSSKDLIVKYQYGGLLLHRKGRGSLGFEVLRTIDQQTGVVTETYNHQYHGNTNFVLTGIPRITAQFIGTHALSWAKNNLKAMKTAQGGYHAYIYDSFEKSYTYDGVNTQFVSQTNTRTVKDTWGNVDNISVTVYDKDSNDFSGTYGDNQKTYTVNTYKDRRWGRLETTRVEKTVNGGGKITRNSRFTYNSSNYLHQAIVSPDNAKYKTTTTYSYDTYGNKTQVSVAGYSTNTGSTQTRTTKTEYQGNGRFVHRQHDAMGNYVTYQYNGVYGNAVSGLIKNSTVYSVNSRPTKTFYDDFGRAYKIDHPDSRITLITRNWCLNCVSGSYYYESKTESGKSAVKAYYDKWGREVARYVRSAEEDWDKVFTYYDDQGRVDYVTEPSSTSYRTTYSYNALGQVDQVTKPNGEIVTYFVNGLEQSTLDERGNAYFKYANGFGQTTKTIDALGGEVQFKYDAYGNLKETITEADGKSSKIQNWYDTYGRKTKMTDPDKGTWIYTYNAFGELYTQKTARGHTFTLNYDKLGRKIRSYQANEGTLCWHYATNNSDNRDAYKAGRLFATAKYDGKNQSCGTSPTTAATIRKYFKYDSAERPIETRTYAGGKTYYQNTSFDGYSRPSLKTFPADSQGNRLQVKMHYKTSSGALYKITNNATGALLKEVKEFDRRRQAVEILYGNNIRTHFGYRGDTGWHTSTRVMRSSSAIFYSGVTHDEMGNVKTRTTEYGTNPGVGAKFTETYTYDDLNRLDYRSVSVGDWGANMPSIFDDNIDYQYDGFGNLKKKNGVSNYNYSDANRVHRLTSATGFGSFAYDNNGNIRSDGTGRTFNYGTYDKPTRITKGGLYADMKYGVDRELYFKKEKRVEAGKTNEYQTIYLGNYEEVRRTGGSGSSTEHKYYVAGDIVISHRSNGTKEYSYLHKDHQGSITTVTNVNGTVVQQAFFDPFGKRTQIHQASVFANASYMQPTDRGYTGHNMMDGLGIIHMNGRIYDPTLGRFLQADPFIQAPLNSQNYNRYSYVLNNPMSYTDPSGYFFSKLWKGVKKFAGVIAGAALIYFTGGTASWFVSSWYGAAAAGAISGAVGAAANGGNILTGALRGAFSAAAFYGVGQMFDPGTFGNIVGNGVVGGVMSDLQGGNFGHGFFAAGFSAAAKPMIYEKFGYAPENAGARVVTAAVIGGTASVISGGKFANGATTGAFSQMFNGESYAKDSHKLLMRLKDRVSDEEWQYLMDNKLAAPGIAAATLQAYNKAAELYPNSLHNGEGDAFRHAYWNALITRYTSAEHAEAFTSLHEQVGGGPAIENTMDMHNNAIGRALATETTWLPSGFTHRYGDGAMRLSLQTAVTNSLNSGQLWYIKDGQLVSH